MVHSGLFRQEGRKKKKKNAAELLRYEAIASRGEGKERRPKKDSPI